LGIGPHSNLITDFYYNCVFHPQSTRPSLVIVPSTASISNRKVLACDLDLHLDLDLDPQGYGTPQDHGTPLGQGTPSQQILDPLGARVHSYG